MIGRIERQRTVRYAALAGPDARSPTVAWIAKPPQNHAPMKKITPAMRGASAPERTVRAKPSISCAPTRCAATIDVPLRKPALAIFKAKNIVFAAVAPASATTPRLPIAIVSTMPRS